MFSQLQQIRIVTITGLGSLHRRTWISLSMVLSIALVVCVLIGFLAMAKGFEKALTLTSSPEVAIILGGGPLQETASEIPAASYRSLLAASNDRGIALDVGGQPMVSRELIVPITAKAADNGQEETLSLRGMDQIGATLRDNIKISAGRLFSPGTLEIVVGDRIARDFQGFELNSKIRLGTVTWTVVGHFSAGGSAFESEIWSDIEAAQSAFDRQGTIQTLRAKLTSPQALPLLQQALDTVSSTPLLAMSEATFYAAQSERTARLIRLFGWPIALLMAIGATAGALNTMISSVSDRTVEIATVRAIGFSRLAAAVATWIEAIILALVGALVGMLISFVLFNGWQASTLGSDRTRIAFNLSVTPDLLIQAALLALVIGLVGGGIAAIGAARLPLIAALRGKA